MNLWVNRLRQLTVLSVALIFSACEDDTSFLGFRNPNTKFKNYSVEIPLGEASSVMQLDPIRTVNALTSNERNRLLVGYNEDPRFGKIQSTAFTEFFALSSAKLPVGAVYDSVTLQLVVDDYYYYGQFVTTPLTLVVNRLEEKYDAEKPRDYTNNRLMNIGQELGRRTVSINPALFKEYKEKLDTRANPAPPAVEYQLRLNQAFGQELFDVAVKWSTLPNPVDSVQIKYGLFREVFKGISVSTPATANSLFTAFTTNSSSRIVLHYRESASATEKKQLAYTFTSLLNHNVIQSDRSAITDLAGATARVPFKPASGKRFVQAGTGLTTVIDLTPFMEFASRDSVQNIEINEAEIVFGGASASDAYRVPPAFALRAITDENKFYQVSQSNINDIRAYSGRTYYDPVGQNLPAPIIDSDNVLYPLNDQRNGYVLRYEQAAGRYSGFLTLFLQRLFDNKNQSPVFKRFVLVPLDPAYIGAWNKSVARVIFPSDQMVLRIKYTKPTVNENK